MANTVEVTATGQVLVTQVSEQAIEVQAPGAPLTVEVATAGPQGPTAGLDPTFQSIQLLTTGGNADTAGELAWNEDEQTLDIAKGNGTVLQVGQEISFLVHNDTANTITEGTGVMYAGTHSASGQLQVAPMLANGTLPGHVFLGVMTQTVPSGAEGFVTTFGKVRGINTSAYPTDSILYCDPATPGAFVTTEPDGPNLKLPVAVVIHSGNNGVIFVRSAAGTRIGDCHDVEVSDPHDGDLLTWVDAANRYEHRQPIGGSAPRSITIAAPQLNDSFTLFRTTRETTISSVMALVSGGSVTYEIRYASDRSTTGTLAATDTVTNTTTGDSATLQNLPIPAGRYVWVKVTAVTGIVNEFNLSVGF